MTLLPTVAHEEARAVLLGFCCAGCGEPFVRAHQQPVVCGTCFRMQDTPKHPRAKYDESTKAHFRNEARKAKATRQTSKWAGFAIAPRTSEENR